jgi:hypothetical protein
VNATPGERGPGHGERGPRGERGPGHGERGPRGGEAPAA